MAGRPGSYRSNNERMHKQRLESLEQRAIEERRVELTRERDATKGGRGEPEVVLSSQLAPLMNEWRKKWDAEHSRHAPTPTRSGRNKRVDYDSSMGPLDWLSEKTGINARRLNGMMRQEMKHISLSQADLVLVAIDRLDAFHHTVLIIPNPNWTMERWTGYMTERGCI